MRGSWPQLVLRVAETQHRKPKQKHTATRAVIQLFPQTVGLAAADSKTQRGNPTAQPTPFLAGTPFARFSLVACFHEWAAAGLNVADRGFSRDQPPGPPSPKWFAFGPRRAMLNGGEKSNNPELPTTEREHVTGASL